MKRRDVIIVSVLVNAGLLAVLFVTAVRSDTDLTRADRDLQQIAVVDTPTQGPTEFSIQPESIEVAETIPMDEVDHVLREYLPELPAETFVSETDASGLPLADASVSNNESIVEITVKRGDMLEKIARANQTTVEAIKKANNLTSDKLKIGQVLKVPVGTVKPKPSQVGATKVESKSSSAQTAASDPVYYTLKSGDNPWKIAKQYQVRFEDLLRLNNLDEERAKNLKAGDKIRVR